MQHWIPISTCKMLLLLNISVYYEILLIGENSKHRIRTHANVFLVHDDSTDDVLLVWKRNDSKGGFSFLLH